MDYPFDEKFFVSILIDKLLQRFSEKSFYFSEKVQINLRAFKFTIPDIWMGKNVFL